MKLEDLKKKLIFPYKRPFMSTIEGHELVIVSEDNIKNVWNNAINEAIEALPKYGICSRHQEYNKHCDICEARSVCKNHYLIWRNRLLQSLSRFHK